VPAFRWFWQRRLVPDAARRLRRWPPLVPAALTALTVLAQISYPLVAGAARDRLTVLIVLLFAAASLSHAWATRGVAVALGVLAVTAVPGFAVEALGVHTGVPFGRYAYAPSLGVRVLDVPVVIALAWTMFAWPAAVVARRLVRTFAARVFVAAWTLASWDLFLDPQMVSAGHWSWRFPAPHLPGADAVPLTNYLGWLGVAAVMCLALQAIVDRSAVADDRLPIVLLLWTWASSTLALAAFLHLGGAAAWGAAGMGLVAVPLIGTLLRSRAAAARPSLAGAGAVPHPPTRSGEPAPGSPAASRPGPW
jgi:uncharacterized membrane protein